MSDPTPKCAKCGLIASDKNLLYTQPDGSWCCEADCAICEDEAAELLDSARMMKSYVEEDMERFADPSYKPAHEEREEVL